MKNFKYNGHSIPFTATADLVSGQVLVIGEYAGVVAGDVADTEEGQLEITGVVEVDKVAATAFGQGDPAYWDIADGEVNGDNANPLLGTVYKDAASADAKILVSLKGGARAGN